MGIENPRLSTAIIKKTKEGIDILVLGQGTEAPLLRFTKIGAENLVLALQQLLKSQEGETVALGPPPSYAEE